MSTLRDRTLILRILVPGLETSLREKMEKVREAKDLEDPSSSIPTSSSKSSDSYLNLNGVTCVPTEARNRTLWNFCCDGATYPAKLVNLPCPVELHKTHDHSVYLKSADVAQMLIVYEDDRALEEADQEAKAVDGFTNYYHSGLTPPTRRIVQNRFANREEESVPPPRAAVMQVEEELLSLMEKLAKDEKKGKGNTNKIPVLTSAIKVLEEVEEVVVDYEPWMDDNGNTPDGIEFDANDPIARQHPEIWLRPEVIQRLQDEYASKKEKKAEKPKQKKKGIANNKSRSEGAEPVDEIAAAAEQITAGMLLGDDNDIDFGNILDLDFGEDDGLELEGIS